MEEFILTSSQFEGHLRFGYTDDILEMFENNARLNDQQVVYLSEHFPMHKDNLEILRGKTGAIKEITDISFEAFWKKYDYKVDRQQAETFWNKMSKPEKLSALAGINKYKYQCKLKNTAMIYPVRYLRNRRWLDEN